MPGGCSTIGVHIEASASPHCDVVAACRFIAFRHSTISKAKKQIEFQSAIFRLDDQTYQSLHDRPSYQQLQYHVSVGNTDKSNRLVTPSMMDVPIESALKEARERLDGEVINWMNQCKLAYAKCDVEPMKTAATALYQQLETTARSLKPLGVDGSSLSGDSVHEERLTQLMKVEFAAAMQRAPQELLNELGRVPQYQALDKQMDADLERGRVFIQFGLNQFFW